MPNWTSANAKRHFAQVLIQATQEPQVILLRGKPVADMVSYETFSKNRTALGEKSMASWLADLAQISETEDGDPETPSRHDRRDPFGEDWE